MFFPSVFCAVQAFWLKSLALRPTLARSSLVMGSSRSPSQSGFARVRWAIATSGGLFPTVASVTFE